MKRSQLSKILALLLVSIMLIGVIPVNAMAATIKYDESLGCDYYQVISKRDWTLAPGIEETEIVLNNAAGARRQVLHTVTVDLNNPYTKVIPGTKGMWPDPNNYGTEGTFVQASNAEKLGYGNVVAATNCSLSWYTEAYYKQNPHLIGEPLGYSILDGQLYANSRFQEGVNGGGVQTIVVINYDNHPITGEPRPADMPKVWIRTATDPLTGWEEQAIPVLFGFLVKPDENGKPVSQAAREDHGSGVASRTFVGVKADGTLVIAVSDGEQAPYSVGFTNHEMADYMIKMGCVIAANCDGGGSTTFVSQRPGEELKINCSLADGGERPTSNTIIVISTAPADGVFAQANITADYEYYAPGASVTFNALGTDAVGTKVSIPSDVEWAIKEEGMGTIENGVFKSNGTEGKVTAQMIYKGNVVGERTITIAAPDTIFFEQPVVTIPFGKTAIIPVKASIGGGLHEIGLGAGDVSFTTTNAALGTFNGLNFTAVSEAEAPADITSTVTATLVSNPSLTATVQLNLGKGSEVLFDFEGGQADIDIWNVINNRKNAEHWDYYLNLSLADRNNGQVHDGEYSMRLETNGLSSKLSHSEQYAWIRLGVDGEAITLKNARSVGFWLYVPEDNIQCWVQGHYMYDSDGDGTLDAEATVSMMESENVYYNIDESGWHYLSMDISAFKEVALKMSKKYDKDPSDGMTGETGEFFLALVFHKAINNKLWQENGSINGNYTYYLDNFTVDYSEAVDDRENPVFDKVYMNGTPLVKRDVVTTTNNVLNFSVGVADKNFRLDADKNQVPLYNVSGLDASTAKAYIDGVEVDCNFDGSKITVDGLTLADGYHRVKFEICDKVGNKSVIIRVLKVESGESSSTINVVPADPTLDRIYFGSVYWMNLEATAIETIDSVTAVVDLNNVNHWQLDHMYLADGFSAKYTIFEETNTATITITRTGDNTQTGNAVLAKLPVRMLYFDTDIKTPGYTAQTYWTSYSFWAQDLKMDVDMGLITHTDGSTSTFSNEEFHVDSEMYTSMANMDKVYFAEHGTTHVHTPAAIADQAPTCTQPGYTGRTYCDVCDSVVDWGTTVPATGHTYAVSGDKLACACGVTLKGTGLQKVGEKYYYTVNGTLTSGWLTIEDEWYYFDKWTYSNLYTLNNGYVTYKFHENGKLVSGEWYKDENGIRYYEGPSYLSGGKAAMTWYTIDGKEYCFEKSGYVATGTRPVNDMPRQSIFTWYVFDENGVSQGKWDYTGPAEWNGDTFYVENGLSRAGMFYANGAYYYANFDNFSAAIKNVERNCYYNQNYGLLPVDTYLFGYDGKMVNNTVYNKDGVLYYYVMGKISQDSGIFTYEGIDYTIESDGKVLFTGVITDASGEYQYYVDGVQTGTHTWDNGVVTTPSTCTTMGLATYTCQDCGETVTVALATLAHVDENGDYKGDDCGNDVPHDHIWDKGVLNTHATCTVNGSKTYTCPCGEIKVETIVAPGHLDENGDMVCDLCGTTVTVKNGLVLDEDGHVRYYVNGVATRAGLVVDSQGNYYYINSTLKAVKGVTYAITKSMTNGLLPAGSYTFDDDGKMIDPPAGEPIHVHAWGEVVKTTPATCIENGFKFYICECGMSKTEILAALGHTDENGDFTCDIVTCQVILPHDHVWGEGVVTLIETCVTEGVKTYTCPCGKTKTEAIPALGHIDEDLSDFCDRCDAAVEHVHKWDDGVITTPASCTEAGVKTYTCRCKETKTEAVSALGHINENGDFACDRCGEILPHSHVWNNSVVTTPADCTNTGVMTYTCDCGETKTETIPAVGHLDENGDLACDHGCGTFFESKNGLVFDQDGNIRYYENGKAIRAGLVQDAAGNYYYINSTLKAVKGVTYAISASMTNGLLPTGIYEFDAVGKMINPPVIPDEPETEPEEPGTEPDQPDQPEDPSAKNGLIKDDDGEIRFYKDGVAVKAGLVQDAEGNYYYINSTLKAVKNCTYAFSNAAGNGLLPGGTYEFDADGKMINPPVIPDEPETEPEEPSVKNGLVKDSDGEIRFYKDGVAVKAGLVQDAEGNYYYINSTLKAVKNCTYAFSTAAGNGLLPGGTYQFDADGKMITSPSVEPEQPEQPEDPSAKNGLIKDDDGNIRYYKNGVAIKAGLVQDAEGNYYYINSTLKAVKNCTYAFSTAMGNGLLPGGTYQFDAEGKLILE